MHAGLHHHGKEENLPGYTLEEATILMRSQIPSQRIIALRLITELIRKLKAGYFSSSISGTKAASICR